MRMDRNKRSLIGLLLTVAFVSACSGGSSDIDSAATSNPNIQQTSVNNFSAIAGVWDESFNDDGVIDVLYWVINADGTYANVDYRGDDSDNDEHCYHYVRGRVTTSGADGYVFDGLGSNNITITALPYGAANIDFDSSTVLYHLRVINGELAILDGSNGSPTIFLPPVPGGLDPTIPECPPLQG